MLYYPTDKVYIISLNNRKDRLSSFFKTLPSNIFPSNKISIYDAIVVQSKDLPQWWSKRTATYGCYLSHFNILNSIIEHNFNNTIIFEDDAIFCQHFSDLFNKFINNLPDDWDQAYLGGQHHESPTIITNGVVKSKQTTRTHAYIIKDPESAKKILFYLNDINFWNKNIIPRHIEWAYAHLHKLNILNSYASDPFIVGQNIGQSDISGKFRTEANFWNK